MLGQVTVTQLIHKALGEAFLDREGVVLGTLVLAVIVDSQLIRRDGIIGVHLIDRHIPGLVIPVFLFGSRGIIQHRILLELRLDTLLKLLNRQLDQFDRLDLERG